MKDVWNTVCTDRGQHPAVAVGVCRLLARSQPGGIITQLVPVPFEKAENLGGRDRAAREAGRIRKRELGFGGWPLDVDRIPVSRTYTCGLCNRKPKIRHSTLVREANLLQERGATRRDLDISYLG